MSSFLHLKDRLSPAPVGISYKPDLSDFLDMSLILPSVVIFDPFLATILWRLISPNERTFELADVIEPALGVILSS